jgi:AhpD family alkylhydroperoxidase
MSTQQPTTRDTDEQAGSAQPGSPRITPGGVAEIGRVNALIARSLGIATGGPPPNLFTTLARHRRLFRRWLAFAGALMPGGSLPREDTELVILRVAHNTGCEYEWRHHERLAALAGLTTAEIERARQGPDASGWSQRQAHLLSAVDELHGEGTLSGALWAQLRPLYSDPQLIELCMLVGHYEMLAMTLNTLAVQPDPLPSGPPGLLARVLQRAANRRGLRRRPRLGSDGGSAN